MTTLLPPDNIIRESIVPRSGQIIDGEGRTYLLADGWDFIPINIDRVTHVTLRDMKIIASNDALERLAGIITMTNSTHIKLDNVQIIGSGDSGGTRHQTICWVQHCRDVTLNNCEMGCSPKNWNLWLAYTEGVSITGGQYHDAYYDGIKVGNDNYQLLIQNAKCHHNGRKSAGAGATGDGIDITHGASGGVDLIAVHCWGNDNGLTFKYAPWRDHTASEDRVPVYGVNVVGGSYDHNGNGIFFQGFSGEPPAGADGSNCPFPMGLNVRGVSANFNDNTGIVLGAGSYNLTDCLTYRNKKNGLDLSTDAKWCTVRNHRSIANGEANINQWGPHNSFYSCYCDGRDVIAGNHADLSKLKKVSKRGINWQWKPAKGKAHGFVMHTYNEGSKNDNGQPPHLPDYRWRPVD
jgi:hypothetical protein|tara:strand:- start:3351 stop:4568 length:1218 start_codon:yes stop_codon:yes gene_type:complete